MTNDENNATGQGDGFPAWVPRDAQNNGTPPLTDLPALTVPDQPQELAPWAPSAQPERADVRAEPTLAPVPKLTPSPAPAPTAQPRPALQYQPQQIAPVQPAPPEKRSRVGLWLAIGVVAVSTLIFAVGVIYLFAGPRSDAALPTVETEQSTTTPTEAPTDDETDDTTTTTPEEDLDQDISTTVPVEQVPPEPSTMSDTVSEPSGDDADQTPAPTTTVAPEAEVEELRVSAEELSRSVVQIQLLLGDLPVCSGSGTIIDDVGTIVTNFHVVEQSEFCPHDSIGVALSSTSSAPPELLYQADLLSFDRQLDIAVVRIARTLDGDPVTSTFAPIEIGDSSSIGLGEAIQVIGYPGIGGETVTFTTGSVSGFADTADDGSLSWIKTDASITGGNSGGLAADANGRFIGIPTRAGAGDGAIVDCRVIADSNGDGGLDADDSCIPIGGFINGIRPVALALPLIESAATAAPIDQGPPAVNAPPEEAQRLFADFPLWSHGSDIENPIAAGIAGETDICLTWTYEGLVPGSATTVTWTVDQVTPEEPFSEIVLDDPADTLVACFTDEEGIAPGIYELTWVVNDEPIFAEGIIVGSGATSSIEVFNDSVAPICAVQFNPNQTLSYGLNELVDIIEPGESAFFEVNNGPIDARIIDCNGDIRIEDASGFDLQEDILLTVS